MVDLSQPEPPAKCPLCPRLVLYRKENEEKHPDWFNGAVPSFGSDQASLLVTGLAPGVTGANRTARPFTGDWAGDLLYATTSKFGFSRGIYDKRPDDGFELVDCMITNAVRCVPPQNKPIGAEMKACRPFLTNRIKALPKLKVIVALGKIAHDNVLASLGYNMSFAKFTHGGQTLIDVSGRQVVLLDSYHCSRYNTNTGRLTEHMFEQVFAEARRIVDAA